MDEGKRTDGPDRRRVQRGGRRASDKLALTPELQAEAAGYASEIERCLSVVNDALERQDMVAARAGARALQEAAAKLRRLLTTGQSTVVGGSGR